jgi:site-specific DNA recombinase
MSEQLLKRAAVLLRVSSPGQVRTDYDPEGLSIPAQREACEGKARAVAAEVVREYIEPGVSGGLLVKRKVFRQMLADIHELQDIDYVIVWSVSRWARNQEDHWTARGLINRAGAKLISVKEPIGEDTSHGVVVEGVMAAVAAGRRIEISEDVTRGIRRKVEVGGFPAHAPLGYLNIREPLPQGGEVRTIATDCQRAEIIRWGFETYATGLYSISDIVTLFAARGLRSRGNRRYSPRPLNHSAVHALLSNPFYYGKFLYKGKLYEGRHDPIINQELFDRVQWILRSHRLSGERDRKYSHHLKGTIHCNFCGHRLTYSRNTGNGGTYEYFICPSNQRGNCPQRAQRVDAVEAAIERHYKTIMLTASERDSVVAFIERQVAKQATASEQEISRCTTLLTELKEQERKLLDKHYKDDISDELFSEEAARIKRERLDAQTITARLNIRYEELKEFLTLVLKLASADLHDLYLRAKPHIRRLMNQAIFEAIWVWDEQETRAQLASPLKEVMEINNAIQRIKANAKANQAVSVETKTETENDEASDAWETSEDFALGSISTSMVELAGLEPATSWVRSRVVFRAMGRFLPANSRHLNSGSMSLSG